MFRTRVWLGALPAGLPSTYRRFEALRLSSDFRRCTQLIAAPTPTVLKPTEILVENRFLGVNASDVNFTAGKYRPSVQPPFPVGFEAVGTVAAVGETAAARFAVGDSVATQHFGAFAEMQVVPMRNANKIPPVLGPGGPRPATGDELVRYLSLEISGCTASIALEEVAKPQRGETAVVTAACGGTGSFAVQLLKRRYGCRVVGTCSSEAKADVLRRMGCDRVVNYRTEQVGEALRSERGVHLAYESVGGSMFHNVLQALSPKGRMIVIGNMQGYASGAAWRPEAPSLAGSAGFGDGGDDLPAGAVPISTTLVAKSCSLHGFFLPHYPKHHQPHFDRLCREMDEGIIRPLLDGAEFRGIEAVPDAIAYLHTGRNIGKVYVRL